MPSILTAHDHFNLRSSSRQCSRSRSIAFRITAATVKSPARTVAFQHRLFAFRAFDRLTGRVNGRFTFYWRSCGAQRGKFGFKDAVHRSHDPGIGLAALRDLIQVGFEVARKIHADKGELAGQQ